MTVAELIKKLEKLPQSVVVMVVPPEGDALDISQVELVEDKDEGDEVVNIIVW